MSDTPALLAALTAQLHTLPTSNPDQAFIRRYLGTPRPVLGVRADDLRTLAKASAKAHNDWPDAQWLDLLDRLYTADLFEQRRYSGTPLSGPDFAKLAEAYGAMGLTVTHAGQVDDAIDTAYATPDVVVIDFRVEREVNVFPMVPQGKSIGEMITDQPAA